MLARRNLLFYSRLFKLKLCDFLDVFFLLQWFPVSELVADNRDCWFIVHHRYPLCRHLTEASPPFSFSPGAHTAIRVSFFPLAMWPVAAWAFSVGGAITQQLRGRTERRDGEGFGICTRTTGKLTSTQTSRAAMLHRCSSAILLWLTKTCKMQQLLCRFFILLYFCKVKSFRIKPHPLLCIAFNPPPPPPFPLCFLREVMYAHSKALGLLSACVQLVCRC